MKDHRISQHLVVEITEHNDGPFRGLVVGRLKFEDDITEEGETPRRRHIKSYPRNTEEEVLAAVRSDIERDRI